MSKTVLVTGGAGFIGSHVADELLGQGLAVRALDNLCPQAHGRDAARPDYLHKDVELIVGDVADPATVRQAIRDVDAIVHLAAAVGIGPSMHRPAHYVRNNDLATARLLEAVIEQPVPRLVIASSMSVYGEGLYVDQEGRLREPLGRSPRRLASGKWELVDEKGRPLEPLATPESKPPMMSSIYALTKFQQEQLCLQIGSTYHVPTIALRLFNVYGPRQSLSNPYTGALAVFACRLLNDQPPVIFEDGLQQRDFVSVHDVARAVTSAVTVDQRACGRTYNIASGRQYTVLQIVQELAAALDKDHIEPTVCGKYRIGDVRHCFADISLAEDLLGYRPQVDLQQGLAELGQWLGQRREQWSASSQVAVE